MSKIRHPNLVALLGYSSDGPELLVVYELMQNGSLHDQLHGIVHSLSLSPSLIQQIEISSCSLKFSQHQQMCVLNGLM